MFASLTMRLDHRFTVRRASAFVDNALDEHATARVERHLAVCPMCAEFVRTLRSTIASLRTFRTSPPGDQPDVARSILDRLADDPRWTELPERPADDRAQGP